MKKLSDHAFALTQRLYSKPNLVNLIIGKSGQNREVLEELAQCGEPAVIPHIAPILVTGTHEDNIAAAKAIATLLSQMSAEELVSLDEHMRQLCGYDGPYGDPWHGLAPQDVDKWVAPGERGVVLLQLSSLHANGFVREAAVKRLSMIHDGSELPYLLLRVNDWVRQIRRAAHKASLARMQVDYTDHFVANLGLVMRLQRVQRTDDHDILDGVSRLLMGRQARPALISAMHSSSREIRRASFRFLISGEPDGMEQSVLAALTIADPVIRLWGTRSAATTLDRTQLLSVLDTLSVDPSPFVRREALSIWANTFPNTASAKLTDALLDSSAAVRAQARFHLKSQQDINFVEIYRNAMATTILRRLVTAMSGLAETGVAADTESLGPYVRHPIAKVRRTAIRCLMKLAGDQFVGSALGMLLDPAPSVSGEAKKALQPYATSVGATQLWTMFETSSLTHVRQNLLLLLAALPKWERISFLIRAAADDDDTIASVARKQVRRWNDMYNGNRSTPTTEQLSRLNAALSQSASRLTAHDVDNMRLAIRSFSRE